MVHLTQNDFIEAVFDPATRIVRLTRSRSVFSSAKEIRDAHRDLVDALDRLGRKGKSLLVDTRLAPPRNDKDFERAFAPVRAALIRDMERIAVLTRTVTGQLQVQRHARESGESIFVFVSERDALHYLRTGIDPTRTPEKA